MCIRDSGYVGSTFRVSWTVTNTYEQRGKIYQDYVALVQDLSLIHISEPTRPY